MEASAPHPARVYLVDDHEVVRRGVRDLLEDHGFAVVGEAATAAEAVVGIEAEVPHVVVLDNRLADASGVEVCREIRARHPEVAVLMLTSYDDDEALFAAIMAGAAGYVLKQVRGSDLVEIVGRVATGQCLLDPAVTARVLERLRTGQGRGRDLLAELTPQEQRVFELIGAGLSNRQIAREMTLAEKTVKNYVSAVLAKVGVETRTQAAILASRRAAGATSGAPAVLGPVPAATR